MDLTKSKLMTEALQKKWSPILDHPSLNKITDSYRKSVTATLLENQEKYLTEADTAIASTTANASNWNPILISLVRRSMPSLIAYDICGVQPMTGPTGLIFAMRSRYVGTGGTVSASSVEALFREADSKFSGATSGLTGGVFGSDPGGSLGATGLSGYTFVDYKSFGGMNTYLGEQLGTDAGGGAGEINAMGFTIEQATVTATTRALKAEYSMELQQDLKAIHGLDAETELANILVQEILAEINREIIRKINIVASTGGAGVAANGSSLFGVTNGRGLYNLDTDADGRWSVEKFKGLLFQIEREANAIARMTRRGKGNIVVCSSNVASALAMAGILDYAPALEAKNKLVSDDSSTFAGILNDRYKVYVDPYFESASPNTYGNTVQNDYYNVGYRGSSAYDAGCFYCPYVPLQMVRAVSPDSFQPKIAFRTRYGFVNNPFVKEGTTLTQTLDLSGDFTVGSQVGTNPYYRKSRVVGIVR